MAFKFNPITGQFDLVGGASASVQNFSYNKISSSQTVSIPDGQVMITYPSLDIEGALDLDGDLYILRDNDSDNFSYDLVSENQKITVKSGQQMIVDNFMEISGILEINGKVIITEV